MKSKISLFNKAVFKRNLTGGWCLWAAVTLFYIMILPVSMYGYLADALRPELTVDSGMINMCRHTMIQRLWSMGLFVPVFAVIALICAMFVFSYLFTGRNSNMMHTYPVSRYSLFTTNYLTGLLFMVVPMILAALLTLAAGAAHGVVNGAVIKYYLIWIATASIENLFFFSMAVCVLMFVGNIVAVPALYLILNFLYEGCIMIAETMLSTVCYGLESCSLYTGSLGVLTPIVYLSRVGVPSYETYEQFQYPLERMNALPGYFAAAVLFLLIALAAYRKKHIETAGDVITVKWLKPIFRWGAAVCTSALGALFFSSIFYSNSFFMILSSAAVIGIVVFFIAQMLLDRTIHVFTKRKIQECILYTAIVCGCYIALNMDVIGLEKKIPAKDEIRAVQVRGNVNVFAMSEEEISWVYDIHSQIIAHRKEFKRDIQGNNFRTGYARIEYLLKDGSVFRRVYEMPSSDDGTSVSEQMRDYEQQPEVQLKQLFGVHYPDVEIYGGKWEQETYTNDGEMNDGEVKESRISEADAKQLYEALVQDVYNGKMDDALVESEETVETQKVIGTLTLEVRDEAGFISALDSYGMSGYVIERKNKEGQAVVYVDQRFTCLTEKMEELGIAGQ